MLQFRRIVPLLGVAVVSSAITAAVTAGIVSAGGKAGVGHTYVMQPRDRVTAPAYKWACAAVVDSSNKPAFFSCYPTDIRPTACATPVLWLYPNRVVILTHEKPSSNGATPNVSYWFFNKKDCHL